jgi:D-alanine-D-alanine ligase
MQARRKQTVAVVFGGRSVEHDVSIVTAHQIMRAFDRERYTVVPVYIDRSGRWQIERSGAFFKLETFRDEASLRATRTVPVVLSPDTRHHGLIVNPLAGRWQASEVLRLDALFPALHGTHGEDGTIQGLCELADIPYVGMGTMASALTNDKHLTKQVLRQAGIPVLPEVVVRRHEWVSAPEQVLQMIRDSIDFPLFVKPATLGSSIGVARVDDPALLQAMVGVAMGFDQKAIVEPAVQGVVELNCAVIGDAERVETSVIEQPVSWEGFLSYEDKYLHGNKGMKSADRIVPAPIEAELAAQITDLTRRAFIAVDGRGIARIDYLYDPAKASVYLNEINAMPGSLALYLWDAAGWTPERVVDRLLDIAGQADREKRRNIYDFQSGLVGLAASRGTGGAKGKAKTAVMAPAAKAR